MMAYKIPKERWIYKLAPNLTGKAQQAYTVLSMEEANDYQEVKKAILVRYDINAETYRRHFRSILKRSNETYQEMAMRATDLFYKWTRECDTKSRYKN